MKVATIHYTYILHAHHNFNIEALLLSADLFHTNKLESIAALFIIPLAIVLEVMEISHLHSGTMLISKHVIWVISSPVLVTSRRAPIRPNPGTKIYLVRESYPSIIIATRCIKECCFDEVVDCC